MTDSMLIGINRFMFNMPGFAWRRAVDAEAAKARKHLGFMTPEHHLIRNFVVMEIARTGRPLSPVYISESLGIAMKLTGEIIDELERRMTFLFRNEQGEVVWAYPVTAEKTSHTVRLNTGEEFSAA
jgi:hypothetical protein